MVRDQCANADQILLSRNDFNLVLTVGYATASDGLAAKDCRAKVSTINTTTGDHVGGLIGLKCKCEYCQTEYKTNAVRLPAR